MFAVPSCYSVPYQFCAFTEFGSCSCKFLGQVLLHILKFLRALEEKIEIVRFLKFDVAQFLFENVLLQQISCQLTCTQVEQSFHQFHHMKSEFFLSMYSSLLYLRKWPASLMRLRLSSPTKFACIS